MLTNTCRLKKPGTIFSAHKERHMDDLVKLIKQSKQLKPPLERPETLYMIVGLKICGDANISRDVSRNRDKEASAQVPIQQIVQGATGALLPVDANPGAGVSAKTTASSRSSRKFNSGRIFAGMAWIFFLCCSGFGLPRYQIQQTWSTKSMERWNAIC